MRPLLVAKAEKEADRTALREKIDKVKKKAGSWAACLARVFEVYPLICPKCRLEMKPIAVILNDKELVRTAISGPFLGWGRSTFESADYFAFGFAALLGARWLADAWLFSKATFNDEIFKNTPPNRAAGILDALVFIGASVLLGWVLG